MNTRKSFPLLLACLMAFGIGSALADSTIYNCLMEDGSSQLSNESGPNCQQLVEVSNVPGVTDAAAPSQPEVTKTKAEIIAESAPAPDTPKTVPPVLASPYAKAKQTQGGSASAYRDMMVQSAVAQQTGGGNATGGGTSASSRRYLMIDRTTYQQINGLAQ